jgi:hypothetical protein
MEHDSMIYGLGTAPAFDYDGHGIAYKGCRVATMNKELRAKDRASCDRLAALFCEAPAMLEALRGLLEDCDKGTKQIDLALAVSPRLDPIRRLLAKIEGK